MTETTSPDCPRDPILRIVPRPADINAHGHIFGGWVLSQMDIAGVIVAGRFAQVPTATVAIDAMAFLAPILLGAFISFYSPLHYLFRPSLVFLLFFLPSPLSRRSFYLLFFLSFFFPFFFLF